MADKIRRRLKYNFNTKTSEQNKILSSAKINKLVINNEVYKKRKLHKSRENKNINLSLTELKDAGPDQDGMTKSQSKNSVTGTKRKAKREEGPQKTSWEPATKTVQRLLSFHTWLGESE